MEILPIEIRAVSWRMSESLVSFWAGTRNVMLQGFVQRIIQVTSNSVKRNAH